MLTSLRQIVLEFCQDNDLDQALSRIVSRVKSVMDTDCCSIYLADHHKQHFLLVASDGLAKESLGHTSIGFSEGLIGLVGQREEPLNIANAQRHPHFVHAPEVQEEALNAFLGTPIIHQRKVLGVISIQQEKARFFNENEEAFLVTLAAQIATAIANAEASRILAKQQSTQQLTNGIQGVAGSSGVALATTFVVQPRAQLSAIAVQKSQDEAQEKERFEQALIATRKDFEQLSAQISQSITDASVDIFEVYKQLLGSGGLAKEIVAKISEGWTAESALKLIVESYVLQFERLEDAYFRERATDIKDLGNRLLMNFNKLSSTQTDCPEAFILVADDVSASMVAEYQHRGMKGIISLQGSHNSHAAILARALAIPAVMGAAQIPLGKLNSKTCIIDGYSGEIFVNPNESLIREYEHLIAEESQLTAKVKQVEYLPAETLDGKLIEIQLNAGLSSGFEYSKQSGADGIGLYRTEIPFMNKSYFPSEQEQTHLYKEVLSAFDGKNVTMRTLDVGGDKALPYFPIVEDNPFLGWRGIRITLDHPEIFLLQVRAMIRANAEHKNLAIMLPMVSSIAEVDEAKRLINQAYFELSAEISTENNEPVHKPKVGIMIEVPSVIFQLGELATKVDFFSVGSNDLTQYLLAVDRNNARVASIYSAFHPSVLKALNMIAQESQRHNIPLSLCGELASEPAGALLLLAMGYDKISMNPHNVARIKWVIRHINYKQSRAILSKVLTFSHARQVLDYLNEQLEKLELGGFIRAGM